MPDLMFTVEVHEECVDVAKINVVEVVPYIIMKTAALGRGKAKDAYDIYFIIKHYSGGVKALANEFKQVQAL